LKIFLGIDAGSVSTKMVAIDPEDAVVAGTYLRTQGEVIAAVQAGLGEIKKQLGDGVGVAGAAVTGSARHLIGVVTGADLVKNEITAQAEAAIRFRPDVRTVMEIGGQDSKIIIIRDGMVADFGMNSICAAGTGSFLDHQAARLNMNIEEFSERARRSRQPVNITGKCTVFAESDMIHRQQTGYPVDDIIYGLCLSLVRNYLSNVAADKETAGPVVFQGGVARNRGIIRALEETLRGGITIPPRPELTGARGAALLAREKMAWGQASCFTGWDGERGEYRITSFECGACDNNCEVTELARKGRTLARFGGRCDRWEGAAAAAQPAG
jgi:predicted CoA-substrate-specific enzyme activase